MSAKASTSMREERAAPTATASFYLDVFQVSKDIPSDIEAPALFDELLDTAQALLGIVDGNIPNESTIAHAAKFLTAAAQAGYRSLTTEANAGGVA